MVLQEARPRADWACTTPFIAPGTAILPRSRCLARY